MVAAAPVAFGMAGRQGVAAGDRLPAFDGVILDMDGLLIDTESTYVHAWRLGAREFGVQLSDTFLFSLSGLQAGDVEARVATVVGERFDHARFREISARIWHDHIRTVGIGLMPGVDLLLSSLVEAGIPYAIATNSETRFASLCLERAGLASRFKVAVCRDEVSAGKPAPDLFIEAAARLGLTSGCCLALEDSSTGLLAAARAGAIPILVNSRTAPEDARGLCWAAYPSLLDVVARLHPVDKDAGISKRRRPK